MKKNLILLLLSNMATIGVFYLTMKVFTHYSVKDVLLAVQVVRDGIPALVVVFIACSISLFILGSLLHDVYKAYKSPIN